ncbi:type II toxin-antitoxin system VapC family toxin [Allosphingosinicella indica]|uniref:Predicted nucleic-acid-binding protein, contains PIN domain n=1 Tax=Allosphingosinicella indica TaxID=941907 RepID=A0A1X7GHA6_9SPHN|nr:type II toxin-antitoxin system VapC family toxin [Allosphingosinicella indica]SMF69096.1 Predicted nucleic-acid-binding protein, contains PIN domain [Allosphingosinicella indica]
MKAIDTNILIRAITGDDPRQAERANEIIASGVFVSSGVWIESEWVLSFSYHWPRDRIADALAIFMELATVHAVDLQGLRWALDRYREGADWADMIHLVDAADVATFVTFDRALARRAGPQAPAHVETVA